MHSSIGWLGFMAYQPVYNAKSIFTEMISSILNKFSLTWVHSLIVKNVSIIKLFSLFKQF